MSHGTGQRPPATGPTGSSHRRGTPARAASGSPGPAGKRLTGERPMQGVTPDSLLALHAAGYRSVIERLGAGPMLDVGCGQGFESVRFVADGPAGVRGRLQRRRRGVRPRPLVARPASGWPR